MSTSMTVVKTSTDADNNNSNKTEKELKDCVFENKSHRVLPPSHILANGDFVYLPPPTEVEENMRLESDVARYQLLNSSTFGKKRSREGGEKETGGEDESKGSNEKKNRIHPLAIASARLQTHGISELSKAINLSTLVSSGDYFNLSNIVQLATGEDGTAAPSDKTTNTATTVVVTAAAAASSVPTTSGDHPSSASSTAVTAGGTGSSNSSAAVVSSTNHHPAVDTNGEMMEDGEDEAKIRSKYLLRRKRQEFTLSHKTLSRHAKRLRATMATDSISLRGLLRLRKTWRLVAPERKDHHHPLQPHDILAIDVQLYNNHNHSNTTYNHQMNENRRHVNLARWVPRFATIQLDHEAWYQQNKQKNTDDLAAELWQYYTNYDYHNHKLSFPTKAEPFSTHQQTNHSHTRIPMYTLQLQIVKSCTNYKQTVTLKPPSDDDTGMMIPSLQHSLFCASLFETIQQEISPKSAWLSSDTTAESFYPAPTFMAGMENSEGVPPKKLCVIYAHQGEIKVHLDSEYSLILQLVEDLHNNQDEKEEEKDKDVVDNPITTMVDSGSQSPEHLHVLCRMLLYHAQYSYHQHCRSQEQLLLERKREEEMNQPSTSKYHALKSNHKMLECPNILSNCVEMGNKFILERKIRKTISVCPTTLFIRIFLFQIIQYLF